MNLVDRLFNGNSGGGGITPSGTIEITENGEGIDVSSYAYADVNVSGGGGGSSEIDVIYQVIPETTFIGERSEYMPDLIYFNIPSNGNGGSPYAVPNSWASIDVVFDGISYSLPWWHDDDHYVEGWGEFEYDTTNYIMVPIFTNYPVALYSDFTGGNVSDTNQHTIKFEIVDHGIPITVYKGQGTNGSYFSNDNGYLITATHIPDGESVPFAIQNMSITLG